MKSLSRLACIITISVFLPSGQARASNLLFNNLAMTVYAGSHLGLTPSVFLSNPIIPAILGVVYMQHGTRPTFITYSTLAFAFGGAIGAHSLFVASNDYNEAEKEESEKQLKLSMLLHGLIGSGIGYKVGVIGSGIVTFLWKHLNGG